MNNDTEHRRNITQQSIDRSEIESLRDELATINGIIPNQYFVVHEPVESVQNMVQDWSKKYEGVLVERDRLRARAAAAEERVKELEKAFRHTHKAKAFKSDACATCPFDLRDPIHRRFDDG